MSAIEELDKLNSRLDDYVRLTRRLPEDAIAHQAQNFGLFLYLQLKNLRPGKGTVRAQALALLKTGRGIKVRPSVAARVAAQYQASSNVATRATQLRYRKKDVRSVLRKGKRLNLQALSVQAELNVRERGAGFLSISSRFPDEGGEFSRSAFSQSVFGQRLAELAIKTETQGASARFVWGADGPLSLKAATGLSTPRAQKAIETALKLTREDMLVYIQRKESESRGKAKI
jgi:hypothetical protein